jgi:hypothetical protein
MAARGPPPARPALLGPPTSRSQFRGRAAARQHQQGSCPNEHDRAPNLLKRRKPAPANRNPAQTSLITRAPPHGSESLKRNPWEKFPPAHRHSSQPSAQNSGPPSHYGNGVRVKSPIGLTPASRVALHVTQREANNLAPLFPSPEGRGARGEVPNRAQSLDTPAQTSQPALTWTTSCSLASERGLVSKFRGGSLAFGGYRGRNSRSYIGVVPKSSPVDRLGGTLAIEYNWPETYWGSLVARFRSEHRP